MYNTRLEEIRKELEWDDPGKTWHKLAWELLELVEESKVALVLAERELDNICGYSGSAGNWPLQDANIEVKRVLGKLGKKPNDNP